jgi:hypothetical protein
MIFDSNIFCEPSPSLNPLASEDFTLEWSTDGTTWNGGDAPAGVEFYFRVTAPSGVDVSAVANMALSGPGSYDGGATVAGQVVTSPLVHGGLAAGSYLVQLLDGATPANLLYTAGDLIFS